MSPEDLTAWVHLMKRTRRWSKRRCCRELDIAYNSLEKWMTVGGAHRYIGLACTALTMGWPAWTLELP